MAGYEMTEEEMRKYPRFKNKVAPYVPFKRAFGDMLERMRERGSIIPPDDLPRDFGLACSVFEAEKLNKMLSEE